MFTNRSSESIRRRGKVLRFPVSRRVEETHDGGNMTTDTVFKEFVEGEGIGFCTLNFGSRKYTSLVEAFNKVKFKLGAEEAAREYEKARAWLTLNEQYALEALRSRRARRPKRGARVADLSYGR
jgi:hypothetical protein